MSQIKFPFWSSLISAESLNSSMRFIALTVIINIMVIWSIVCIKKFDIVDIPWGVLGMAGLVLTGKVLQKKFENGNEEKKLEIQK